MVEMEVGPKLRPISTPALTVGHLSMEAAYLNQLEYVLSTHERSSWKERLAQQEGSAHQNTFYTLLWRLRLDDVQSDALQTWPSTALLQRRAYRHLRNKFASERQPPLAPTDDTDMHPLQEMVGGSITYPRRLAKK